VGEALVNGADLSANPKTASHAQWAAQVKEKHPELSAGNVTDILQREVGLVFSGVLEDAGVFKRDEKGREAFARFTAVL
jgi:UDPglucose--hexose-1-phosphate uridylyltransferase